jgi:hypothetical protein
VVSDAAPASERRQKAGAILMSLSLLDSAAQCLRVEAENRSERKLGQFWASSEDRPGNIFNRSWILQDNLNFRLFDNSAELAPFRRKR